MCLSNFDNQAAFANEMREIESGRDELEPHQAAQIIADQLYQEALRSEPMVIANALFLHANSETDSGKRATLHIAAVMLLRLSLAIKGN